MNINGEFQITLKLLLWDKNYYLYLIDKVTNFGDLPGGRITQKEHYDWISALKREVKEELGDIQYTINPEPVYCFPHFVSKDKKDSVAILFEGYYLGGTINISEEHEKFLWVHKNEELDKLFSDTMLIGLKKYFSLKKIHKQ
jgi:8-oxo-dGTP pyrophosphatase MutT (NUDIX family)